MCIKEYSYEGGASAVYTLVGSPANCTGAIINGNYHATVPVDSSNSIDVLVHVTTTGNYLITTGMVDGISFSAAGNFTDTGIFTIRLQGNGTPATAGNFQFQISGSNGCFFSIDVTEKSLSEYQFSCDNLKINGDYVENTQLGSLENIDANVNVISAGDYVITTDTINGIYFSASGTFASTGSQTVTLKSFGKPASAGLFYFHITNGAFECSFKLIVRNSDPLAVYVLESDFNSNGNAPCYKRMINGIYKEGVALTAADTVNITIYATYPGNYSISTDSLNGMIFSASGTFTDAVEQTVTLKGYGKPLNTGVYNFKPMILGPAPLGGASCGFDVTVQ